jgi:hypothetical protein
MSCIRYIIVCEGESEWAYLQRLQSFFDQQPLLGGAFEPPLRIIAPQQAIAKGGKFSTLKKQYRTTRKANRNITIQIWADFDLYHRNDQHCADHYAGKTASIPDFLFSYHNFEDFFALHFDGLELAEWLRFGNSGHFTTPLHAVGYLPEIKRIFPGYGKGSLPANFITWDALNNLKHNRSHQPTSNPSNLQGLGSFADFLITEIERAYPGSLAQPPATPAQP